MGKWSPRILRQIFIAYRRAPARFSQPLESALGVGRVGLWVWTGHFTHPPTAETMHTYKRYYMFNGWYNFLLTSFHKKHHKQCTATAKETFVSKLSLRSVANGVCGRLLYKSLEQLPMYQNNTQVFLGFLGKMGISSTMSSSIFLKIQNPQHHKQNRRTHCESI